MGMTTPFPEPDSPDLERYTIYARAEIAALLRSLRGALITAYFDPEPGFGVTALLHVDEAGDRLVFDALSDVDAQRRLLASPKVTFVGFAASIKLQFSAAGAGATQFEGKPAFTVPVPAQLLRLQRRDAYRVHPPLARPATCRVPYGGRGKAELLRVLDISVGGLAVLTHPESFEVAVGTVIDDCQLDLPGVGTATVSLRVRRVDPQPRDEKARRCGCEFVQMAPATRLMLQRYVNQVDADQRRIAAPRR